MDESRIEELIRVLRTSDDPYTWRQVAESLGKIAPGNRRAIEALIELLRTSEDEETRRRAAESLGKIAPGDRRAIEALIEFLRTSDDQYTRRRAARSLERIAPGNPIAIELLRTIEDEKTGGGAKTSSQDSKNFILLTALQLMLQLISFLVPILLDLNVLLSPLVIKIANILFVFIILVLVFMAVYDLYSFIKPKSVIFIFDLAGKYKNIVDFCISKRDRNTAFSYIEKDKQKYVNRFARLANTREKVTYFYKLKSLNPLPKTAIVEFFFTETQLITILVLPGEKSPNPSEDTRWKLKNNSLETLHREWISKLTAKTKKDDETDETLEYLPATIDQISDFLNFKNLLKDIPPEINHLTIIPHKYLHLFPIHALWINDNQRLIDRFSIQYFPNLKIWNICQNRHRQRWEFIGIENPTQDKDLIFAKAEISTIGKCKLFNKTDIFSGQKATRSTILTTANNYHCLHFSGHAEYNYKKPLDSYLMLSDNPDENLTLNTILKNLKMPHTDLVTLSACCTGVVDVFQPADEYLGLATGFLLVGAKAVIGSLWKVNSIATAFLLDELYRQLDETDNKALALQRAQNWLRRRSAEELRERAKTWDLSTLEETEKLLVDITLDDFEGVPFENPYYWAAFILTGC